MKAYLKFPFYPSQNISEVTLSLYTAALFTQSFMYLPLCLYKYHSELTPEEDRVL